MQLRCSPSLYLNLGTCEGYFRHFARASDAWELAQSSLNAWKSVSTRYPTVKYEFYGSDRHFNIWAGLWLFPFPFPTIKASGHYFRFLIRAYNFRVRIQAPTNPSQERERELDSGDQRSSPHSSFRKIRTPTTIISSANLLG